MTSITINQHNMEIKEYNGERVVTFKDVDRAHERPEGEANKRFCDNKKHFIDGEVFGIVFGEAKQQKGGAANA